MQLVGLPAEVECAGLAFRLLAQLLPLALIGRTGRFGTGVEGRIAQGKVNLLVGLDQLTEQLFAAWLQTQADTLRRLGVGIEQPFSVVQRCLVDVATDKTPAIVVVADQWINQIGAGTEI